MTKAKIKENQAQVKSAIAEYINYLSGGVAWVINVSGVPVKGNPHIMRKNPEMKGLADVLGCYRGRFLFIEVKLPGDKEDPDQEEKRLAVEASGGITLLVKSVDDVTEYFEINFLHGVRCRP